jgi:hypothetical protein
MIGLVAETGRKGAESSDIALPFLAASVVTISGWKIRRPEEGSTARLASLIAYIQAQSGAANDNRALSKNLVIP